MTTAIQPSRTILARATCAALTMLFATAALADFPINLSRTAAAKPEPVMVYAVAPGNATVIMSSNTVFHSYKLDGNPATASFGQSFETPRAPILEQSRTVLSPAGDLNWVPVEKDGYAFAFDFRTTFRQEHVYVLGADAKLKRFVRRPVGSSEYVLETKLGFHYISQRGIARTDYSNEEKSLYYLCQIRDCWLPWSVVPVAASQGGAWVVREQTVAGQQSFDLVRVDEDARILETLNVRRAFTPNEFTTAKLWRDRFGGLRLALHGSAKGQWALYNLDDRDGLRVTASAVANCDQERCNINRIEPLGQTDWMVFDYQAGNVDAIRYAPDASVMRSYDPSAEPSNATLRYRKTFTDVSNVTASSSSASGAVALRVVAGKDLNAAPKWVVLDAEGQAKFDGDGVNSASWSSANFGAADQVFATDVVVNNDVAQHRARWFELGGKQIGADEYLDQVALTPYRYQPVFDQEGNLLISAQYAISGDGKSVQVNQLDSKGNSVMSARLPDDAQLLDPNQTRSSARYAFAKQGGNAELWSMDKSANVRRVGTLCAEAASCTAEFAQQSGPAVLIGVRSKDQLSVRKLTISDNANATAVSLFEGPLLPQQILSTANVLPNGDIARVLVKTAANEMQVYGVNANLEANFRFAVPRSADNNYQLMSDGGVLLGSLSVYSIKRRLGANGNELPYFNPCGVRSIDDGRGGVWSIMLVEHSGYSLCHNALNGTVKVGGFSPRWMVEYTRARILPDGDILWQISSGDVVRARVTTGGVLERNAGVQVRGPQYVATDAASTAEYVWTERSIQYNEPTGGNVDGVIVRKIKLPQF